MLQIDSPELDKMFEALSSPKRRGIITTLSYRPATISQLSKEWDMSLPAIHKHLKVLEAAQLIERRKAGRTNFIALNTKALREVQDWLGQYRADGATAAKRWKTTSPV